MYPGKRLLTIAGIVLLYALALILSFNLHLDEKITTMLPDNDAEVADFTFTIDNLPLMDALYIDIQANTDSPDPSNETADRLFEDLGQSEFFTDVLYKISARDLLNLVQLMDRKNTLLINESDLAGIKASLEPGTLSMRFSEIKRQIIGPAGLFSVKNVRTDPLNITQGVMAKLEPLKAMATGITIREGRITSPDGKHILMVAHPDFPAVDTVKGKEMIGFLNRLRQAHETQGVTIGFSGAHVATLDNSLTIQKDVKRTVVALSLAIVLMGALFFRQKRFLVLIFFPAGFGLTLASALVSLTDPYVSAIALGCGAVLVGITVDFGIHLLFHLDQVDHTRSQAPALFASLSRPLATCSGTTALALFSLLFSSIPGQRQMGLFAGTGVLVAALFAGFGLIHFIPNPPRRISKPVIPLVKFCAILLKTKQKNRTGILFSALVLLVLSSWGITRFEFQGNISALNHLSPRVAADQARFMGTWGNTTAVTALVQADTTQEALEKNDRLHDFCKTLEQKGLIKKTASLAAILPSINTQEHNRKQWTAFWNPDTVEKTKKVFEELGRQQGFASPTFAPFFASIPRPVSFLLPGDYKETAIRDLIDSRLVFTKAGKTIVVTTFEALPATDMATLKSLFKQAVPGVVVFDSSHFTRHLAGTVSAEFIKIAAIAVCAILISLFFFLKDPRLVMAAVMPVMAGGYVTLGLLGLLNIPINLISILFIVFVFGVGVDFSVFMIHQRIRDIDDTQGESRLAVTCGSVIICAMTTIVAFGCLMTADHAALVSIGAAGLMGMVSCLVISLVMIPMLPDSMFNPKR
ncbi:MAG: MMPL family transporter [Desulfobacterium sp.]|nr:MMPL family transporter [Desulfobacterium sp.]